MCGTFWKKKFVISPTGSKDMALQSLGGQPKDYCSEPGRSKTQSFGPVCASSDWILQFWRRIPIARGILLFVKLQINFFLNWIFRNWAKQLFAHVYTLQMHGRVKSKNQDFRKSTRTRGYEAQTNSAEQNSHLRFFNLSLLYPRNDS